MYKGILLSIFFLAYISIINAQSYESCTLVFRDGTTKTGEVKILDQRNIKFRENSKKEKKEYNYLKVKEIQIKRDTSVVTYKYKIVVGKKPLLLKVVKEYEGSINLYATDHEKAYGANGPLELNVYYNIYYANKGSGDNVIKLGKDEIIFGSRHFKKTIKTFFEDCPDLIKKIEDKEFKRTQNIIDIVEYYNDNCGKT